MSVTNSRLRPVEVAAVVFVAFFACFVVLTALDARTDGRRVVVGPEASASFLDHWERSREATFAAQTVFTRERVGGASLRFDGLRVQRPPDELVVSFAESELRQDGTVFRCVGGVSADDFQCFDAADGPTHDERVATELEVLASYFEGSTGLYAVSEHLDGCFRLDQEQSHPLPPYGRQATFCFDDATGALQRVELVFANGVIERTEASSIVATVTDEDLRLQPPT